MISALSRLLPPFPPTHLPTPSWALLFAPDAFTFPLSAAPLAGPLELQLSFLPPSVVWLGFATSGRRTVERILRGP